MKGFFKIFFATLLAMIVFAGIGFLILIGFIAVAVSSGKETTVSNNSVLVIDLSNPLYEQKMVNPLNALLRRGNVSAPGLHDVISSVKNAAADDRIKGIYLKVDGDPNGFATNEELRRSLLEFKKSHKFIYAYGAVIPQKAYYVASVADKVYLNPVGGLDFSGFSMQMFFLKGLLDKLDIKPQIFFEGKYKSATEPLRVTHMTPANKEQTTEYLSSLYRHFLTGIAASRKLDTATLFNYADNGLIQTAYDAEKYGLVDGLKYNDEVMDAIRTRLNISGKNKINFISAEKYGKSDGASVDNISTKNRIAVLYAQGDIVSSGKGTDPASPSIASEDYIKLLRKIREDSSIKALVLRVNSPGGSALAADEIWHEVLLTRQVKPVVVSMGDYAASGGYYISCAADSIFAEANTLTGSIGVFGIIPNMQSFFKNKLGVTFDGIKTARYADIGTITRPLNPVEQRFIQASIDSVYKTFKNRVEDGRSLPATIVDSIAQGRVWSGADALKIGLVDKIGGLKAAIHCAARMAHTDYYSLKEYPEQEAPFKELFSQLTGEMESRSLKRELGVHYDMYLRLKKMTNADGRIMARLPYNISVN